MKLDQLWRVGVVVGLFAIAGAVFTMASAPAGAQSGANSAPTRVATVDLVRLINGLEQFQAGQAESDEYTETLAGRVESAQQQAQQAAEDLETMATDANRQELFGEFVDAMSRFRAERASFDVLRFSKQNVILRDTWRTVRESISEYAEANNIDLVISDDSLVQVGFSMDADPETYKQFMMSRRVLFAAEPIDITDELITRMNNVYRASLGGG